MLSVLNIISSLSFTSAYSDSSLREVGGSLCGCTDRLLLRRPDRYTWRNHP